MGLDNFTTSSDYGSGNSIDSPPAWSNQELNWQSFKFHLHKDNTQKLVSYADLISGKCTLQDVIMNEFRMNGSDAPYDPDEDNRRQPPLSGNLPVMRPASQAYARQQSWPAAERPAPRAPRPLSLCLDPPPVASTPLTSHFQAPTLAPSVSSEDVLTDEQRRVLNSLPDVAVASLLRELQRKNKKLADVCRFCKNNNEREAFYRSHTLRDAAGRVTCPVLRAFVCRRCGAAGDYAHTIKYCPFSTSQERIESVAMMRMRKASLRRRSLAAPPAPAPPAPAAPPADCAHAAYSAPLDPLWAALEKKLMF